MIKIKEFTFNPIQVNCYIIYNEQYECIIIDPSCYFEDECTLLQNYITNNNLCPKLSIATHFHFDHLMGASFVFKQYGIKLYGHKDYKLLFEKFDIKNQIQLFDFKMEMPNEPIVELEHGNNIKFGSETLEIIHVPGHSPCGIAVYCKNQNFLFSGDILFEDSIGRTDFYRGDYNLLISGIKEKLLILPDNTIVFPGHGNKTTIGKEKKYNPFL